jgi:hypothetical protein
VVLYGLGHAGSEILRPWYGVVTREEVGRAFSEGGTQRHYLSRLLGRLLKLCRYHSKLGFDFAAVMPKEDYEVAVFYWSLGGLSAKKTELS